jgi:hypothetical protein
MISNDINALNILNLEYNWLPTSETIRPNPKDLAFKHLRLNQIENEWLSMDDYIRYMIFGFKAKINQQNKKQISDSQLVSLSDWVFAESEFKYNLIPTSNHWILWSSKFKQNEKLINQDLIDEINNELINKLSIMIGSDNFDFAWYKNPKPTINEFFHVQVFWISL